MESSLKFAIIGCGRSAQRHAHHIRKFGELVAACEVDDAKGKSFGNEHAIPIFRNHKVMLEECEVDVVAVCSPNGLHAEHSIDSLRAGKHVLCEKPMALRAADCKQMISESVKANKKLFIVKQNRFNPPV